MAYSGKQFVAAVILAALFGWAAMTSQFIYSYFMHVVGMPTANAWAEVFTKLALSFVFGYPLALFACLLVGGPIIWRLMRNSVSWTNATIWGAVTGALIALLVLAIDRLNGWRASQNPNFDYRVGAGDGTLDVDGVLTALGWWVKLQESLFLVLVGIGVALIVRWAIGPGRKLGAVESLAE